MDGFSSIRSQLQRAMECDPGDLCNIIPILTSARTQAVGLFRSGRNSTAMRDAIHLISMAGDYAEEGFFMDVLQMSIDSLNEAEAADAA